MNLQIISTPSFFFFLHNLYNTFRMVAMVFFFPLLFTFRHNFIRFFSFLRSTSHNALGPNNSKHDCKSCTFVSFYAGVMCGHLVLCSCANRHQPEMSCFVP